MSEEFINPIFDLFSKPIDDDSIHQYEYVRYATTDGLEVTGFSGPTYKIVTKNPDSYLLPQKGYLDLVFRISENAAGDLADDSTQLHANVMSLFYKASYFINSVSVEEVEFPVLTTTVRNLLEYSDDYHNKQGPAQWFYTETAPSALDTTSPRVTRIQVTGSGKGKRVRVLIPLSRIFAFMDGYSGAFRGFEHRFEFIKEERASQFLFGPAGGSADRVIFDQMSVWMPKLLPSPAAEDYYLRNIAAKKSTLINYESWNGYRKIQTPSTTLSWQIGATSKKPKYVFCAFQKGERIDTTYKATSQDVNPGVYDNLEVTQIELKVNAKRFPLERYRLNFAAATDTDATEYSRAYKDFLRILEKDSEYDNGSLVSYEQYSSTYPIFAFDLSNDHSLFENTQTNYIEVETTFKAAPGAAYYSNAVIVWDREIKMSSDGDSIKMIRA